MPSNGVIYYGISKMAIPPSLINVMNTTQIIKAKLETINFTFEAYGSTKEEALASLIDGWENHRKDYKTATSFEDISDNGDEVSYFEIRIGNCYRDNENFSTEVKA